jgi:hypothetical protein
MMDPNKEFNRWSAFAPRRLSRIKTFLIHKDQVIVAWFSADEPANPSTQPATHASSP